MLKFRYFQRKTQKKGDFGVFSGENWEDCARFSEELEGKGEMCVFYTLSHTIFECNLGTFSRGEGRQGGGEARQRGARQRGRGKGGEPNMARWEDE